MELRIYPFIEAVNNKIAQLVSKGIIQIIIKFIFYFVIPPDSFATSFARIA